MRDTASMPPGKLNTRKQLVIMDISFDNFHKNFYIT